MEKIEKGIRSILEELGLTSLGSYVENGKSYFINTKNNSTTICFSKTCEIKKFDEAIHSICTLLEASKLNFTKEIRRAKNSEIISRAKIIVTLNSQKEVSEL